MHNRKVEDNEEGLFVDVTGDGERKMHNHLEKDDDLEEA